MSVCEQQGLDLVEENDSDVNFTAGHRQGYGVEVDIEPVYILEVTFSSRNNISLFHTLIFFTRGQKMEFPPVLGVPVFSIVFICDVTQGFKNFQVFHKYFFFFSPNLLGLNV